MLAVDPAHDRLNLVAQRLIGLDPLPARARDLDEDHPRPETAFVEQLAVGPQAVQDALGVVEPVHAQEDEARLVEGLPDFPRAFLNVVTPGDLGDAGRVDRDRERGRLDLARSARSVDPHGRPLGGEADRPAAGPQEVGGVGPALESQQVGAEQALDRRRRQGSWAKIS